VRRAPALWPAAAAAAFLLGVSFFVLQHWLERGRLSDVPVYENYATLMRAGHLPYRDFAVEYPPAALPAFLVPAYLPWSYATSFAVAMGACGLGCILAAAAALRAVGASGPRSTAALFLIGASPLALGSLFDTRFDLWPVLLALGMLAAVLEERPAVAGALAGLAFAAKLWPLVLVPIALAYLARRCGARAATALVSAFVAVTAACVVPFAVLSPAGVWHSLTGQVGRPLQVESLGAAALMAAHHLGGLSLGVVTTHGSQNFSGSLPDAVAALSSGVGLAALGWIWIAFARVRRPTGESVLLGSAAAVAALVAFGKVFSPQFLIWLVPLLPLVRGRRGTAASALLFVALGLTQLWFPDHYWPLALDQASPWCWCLLARDLAVLSTAAVLVWPGAAGEDRSPRIRARLDALRAIRR
jgi:Glycosyltransferase family 87